MSPFLNSRGTFDTFHESAKIPSLKDLLKRIDRGIEISFATASSILLLMASGPVALFGFNKLIKVQFHLHCRKYRKGDSVFLHEKMGAEHYCRQHL